MRAGEPKRADKPTNPTSCAGGQIGGSRIGAPDMRPEGTGCAVGIVGEIELVKPDVLEVGSYSVDIGFTQARHRTSGRQHSFRIVVRDDAVVAGNDRDAVRKPPGHG